MTERVRVRRVLLVEDNPADASLIARFLTRDDNEPYELLTAQSGEEGLECVRSLAPDVVLLDYDLPDLDGLEFLDELRSIVPEERAPVVLAITGLSDPRIAADLIRRGALDYIPKGDLTEDGVRLAVRQAVRTRMLREDLERRTREREASRTELVASLERASYLAGVSELLMRSLDLSAVLETVALLAIPYLADACFVDIVDESTLVRRVVELSEPLRRTVRIDALRRAPDVDGDEGIARALRTSLPASYTKTWLRAAARWDPALTQLLQGAELESLIVVPMIFDERVLGVLSFASLRPHTPHAQAVAEEVARRASAAIVNARAFEAQRAAVHSSEAARRRLHIVSRASEVFARSLDWRAATAALTDVLVPSLCDHATMIALEDGVPKILASASSDRNVQTLIENSLGRTLPRGGAASAGFGAVLRTGQPEFYGQAADLLARLSGEPAAAREAAQALSSYMAVPLPGANGTVLGALVLAGTGTRTFTVDDLAVGEDLGRRAGMFLENARLFEREREIARTLQTSLLPMEIPRVSGVEFSARVIAGVEGVDVAGDWYDVVPLPLGRVAFAVGDVAGRGVLAAAAMGQLRSSLRAYALEGLEPSDALARLNGFVLSQERMAFATVAFGVLDTTSGTMRYASAGHLPPLLIGADGEPRLLEAAASLPVGLMPEAYYEQSEHRLTTGDVLAIYTDGLVESRTRSIDEGLALLLRHARGERGAPEGLVEKLLERLATNAGDDVTVLALRFVPALAPAAPTRAAGVLAGTYPAIPPSAPLARARLRTYLDEIRMPRDRAADVQLAAGEAVANAVEHAYAGAAQPGIFSMRAEVDGDLLVVHILDHGIWRQRSADQRAVLSERGRGFTLMHAVCDDVYVHHDERGTRVRLTFSLPPRADA